MDQQRQDQELIRIDYEPFIEINMLLVEFQEHELIEPKEEGNAQESDGEEQWHASTVDQAQGHSCKYLRLHERCVELCSKVELVEFVLYNLSRLCLLFKEVFVVVFFSFGLRCLSRLHDAELEVAVLALGEHSVEVARDSERVVE